MAYVLLSVFALVIFISKQVLLTTNLVVLAHPVPYESFDSNDLNPAALAGGNHYVIGVTSLIDVTLNPTD